MPFVVIENCIRCKYTDCVEVCPVDCFHEGPNMGNVEQIDTPYLTETTSGLTYAVDRFKNWAHSAHITLRRGERSRLADYASEVL